MAEIREQITELLDQEMDRKHFLQFSGSIFLAAFGIAGVIAAVVERQKIKNALGNSSTGTTKGYGSSKFGKS